MVFRAFVVVFCTSLMFGQAVAAATFTKAQKAELLAAQNKYRIEVGDPPLVWSEKLAASAQLWAEHLAKVVHALQHSGAVDTGENLAISLAGHASLTQLVKIWGDEKQYFVDASFPDISRNGSWQSAGHYSQLVWRKTTKVGCGLATGGGQDYLVCRYNPMGNFMGEKAF